MSTFGERLKIERERKGYKQKELAAKIGITPTRLNYWEKDKREPDFMHIRKIIDVLGCNADYLIGTKQALGAVDAAKQQILDALHSLNEEQVKAVAAFVQYLLEQKDG